MAETMIHSSSSTGMVITMNAFIDPSRQEEYLNALQPVYKAMIAHPENLFCAVTVNPTDAGHVRAVHGWKKNSAWFNEVCMNESLYEWMEFW
jgi:hypothetical protein